MPSFIFSTTRMTKKYVSTGFLSSFWSSEVLIHRGIVHIIIIIILLLLSSSSSVSIKLEAD